MLKINTNFILLSLVFLVAFFARIFLLGSYPAGFHIDEASLGYNGYSMLKTGMDESGNFLPLYVDMFGDFRPSGYHFLAIPSVAIFGLTEFATRFPAALFGALSVFAIYFLTYVLFKDKKVSILSAVFLTLSPWHYVLSRASGEAIISLFFTLFGFALILWFIKEEKIKHLIAGSVIVSFSFFFYHTSRVFVPLLFLVLIGFLFNVWIKFSNKFKIYLFTSFITVSFVSMFLVFGVNGGTGRFTQVNIIKSFETTFQLNQQLIEDSKGHVPRILSRPIHNKVTNISFMFINNYLSYFGLNFLFTQGGLPIWYAIPRVGILLLFELPFILYGIFCILKSKEIFYKIPLVWLLVGPIVAALTLDDIPNINRASVMFPMFEIIAAFGVVCFINGAFKNKKKTIILIISLLYLVNIYYFLFHYFVNAKYYRPWYRNNGFSEMMKIVNRESKNADVVIISKSQGGIYPLVLFYLKYDPATYQKEGSPKTPDYKGFGKIIYVPQDCPFSQFSKEFPKTKRKIYIESGDCKDDKRLRMRRHEYVYREDLTKAFRIVYDYSD